jgi:hypothetical protein
LGAPIIDDRCIVPFQQDGLIQLYSVPIDGSAGMASLSDDLPPGSTVTYLYPAIGFAREGTTGVPVIAYGFTGPEGYRGAVAVPPDGRLPATAINEPLVPEGTIPRVQVIRGGSTAVYSAQQDAPEHWLYARLLDVDADEVLDSCDRCPLDPANDADGDGALCDVDCDLLDPTVFPGAPEINDGRDNQCPPDDGYGVIDEIAGSIHYAADGQICVDDLSGVTMYEVARSPNPAFSPAVIVATVSPADPCFLDPVAPPPGGQYYYLVRAIAPARRELGRGCIRGRADFRRRTGVRVAGSVRRQSRLHGRHVQRGRGMPTRARRRKLRRWRCVHDRRLVQRRRVRRRSAAEL